MSSTCGHDGCSGGTCRVRYVGPVSSIGDHHAHSASRGSTHIWAAALITSLALVVTGTVAFQSAQAGQAERAQALAKQNATRADIIQLKEMLGRMDAKLDKILNGNIPTATTEQMMEEIMPKEGSGIPTNTLPTNE